MNITVCIPTYNSVKTLRDTVESAGDYPFLIYDNESSDGTRDLISDLAKSRNIRTKTIKRLVGGRGPYQNSGFVRHAMMNDVETEYVFHLDSDVVLTKQIADLVQYLAKDVGAVGYTYSPNTEHLQMGATLMRASIARQIGWDKILKGCDCRFMMEKLKELGKSTKQIAGGAIHLKGGNNGINSKVTGNARCL